ncbi:MAG: division/cell wall cluster transcriptional repressor MraZ [Mesorhizobium sp.]
MDRFLSSSVNRIDAKGRVSVPGPFRALLARRGQNDLYAMRALEEPAFNVGGADMLERLERQIEMQDPFKQVADDMIAYVYGDTSFLKLDADGRITMTDALRAHTGITTEVGFLGCGQHFQMWEPSLMQKHLTDARARLLGQRKASAQGSAI